MVRVHSHLQRANSKYHSLASECVYKYGYMCVCVCVCVCVYAYVFVRERVPQRAKEPYNYTQKALHIWKQSLFWYIYRDF